jgi:hypothetical protein
MASRVGRGLAVLILAGEGRWVDPTFAGRISIPY